MEGSFHPRTIYASDTVSFWESIYIDKSGAISSLYNLTVDQKRFILMPEDCLDVEDVIPDLLEVSGDDGVKEMMSSLSIGHSIDHFH